jgi:hypothetical protein
VKKAKKHTNINISKNTSPIEVIQSKNSVIIQNNMEKEQHRKYIQSLADQHPIIYKKIDDLVTSISNLVTRGDPLRILHQSYCMILMTQMNMTSEFQGDFDDSVSVRMLDYVQSIIVSSEPQQQESDKDISEKLWGEISVKVSELYSNLNDYHLTKSAYLQINDPNYDPEYDSIYVQAQGLRAHVRGQRYSIFEIPHLRDLLSPHDSIFRELFNISVEDFLNGISKLQYSLMQGFNDGLNEMELLREKTLQALESKISADLDSTPQEEMQKVIEELGLEELRDSSLGKMFDYDLFDVQKVTGLPDTLLRKLSWAPGEEKSFFAEGEYAGWPLRRMPVEERPFIFIKNKYYCFDVYGLFENLYRVIQRLLFNLKPEYKDTWNEKQKEVSEKLPFSLFDKLLNKPEMYKSIYYPSRIGKKKQWCENDGIIIYDDHIIVIEVKAGSFTYTSPATDFPAYIKSIKTLIKSPHDQAKRFIDYILSDNIVTIYDESHKPIRELRKDDFRQITICCLTLDNFTSFAARAEKLKPLGIEFNELPVWCLSIDDLRVYTNYFESPSMFTHYLEQRIKGAKSEELELFDELDHLGMYIYHNDYAQLAREKKGARVLWQGYREGLDKYFNQLIFDKPVSPKPKQEVPQKIQEIIEWLDMKNKDGRAKIASSLLNLNGETRQKINVQLTKVLERQKQINKTTPLSIFGEAKITFICKQDEVEYFSDEYSRDYVLATLLKAKDDVRLGLYLSYSKNGTKMNVEGEYLTKEDVPKERETEIEKLAVTLAERRILAFKQQNGIKKIGRNDPCPCGSGEKYKKCCGKS